MPDNFESLWKKATETEMQPNGKPLLIQRVKVSRGEIHIIEERCKQCRLCIELCPKKVLRESEKANEKGYHLPEVLEQPKKGKLCVACGFCEVICPEYAIWVEERIEKTSKEEDCGQSRFNG